MDRPHSNFLIPATLVILATALLFAFQPRTQKSQPPDYAPPIAKANTIQDTAVSSSDGKLILSMREEKGKADVTYTFSIGESAGGSQKEIFRKTALAEGVFSIPRNTFSPDNKYLFLKESDAGKTSYLVLSTAGTWLAKDSAFLEFAGAFESKYPDYKITDATGWGGINLIVFNTDKASGGAGPSFWFEVPSGVFIRLSNRFN